MADEFDAYYEWLGIPPKDQPPNHYRLLGIELFEQNLNVIERAADRQMGHVRSFQTGRHGRVSQRLLNELSAAKVCLLNQERKADYDRQLQEQIASSSLPDLSSKYLDGFPDLPPAIPEAIPVPMMTPVPLASPGPSIDSLKSQDQKVITRRRQRTSASWGVLGLMGALLICVPAGLYFFLNSSRKTQVDSNTGSSAPLASNPEKSPGPSPSTGFSEPPVVSPPSTPTAPTTAAIPEPPQVSTSPVPPRLELTVINEVTANVEDSQTLTQTPNVPAEVDETIVSAAGIRDAKFAFCQTLLWNQFDETNRALRKEGYRLSRFRPYLVQGDCRVAAIWLRDGLPSRVVGLTDAAAVMEADQSLRGQGFVPIDCVGLASGNTELFGAVWVRPNSPVGAASLILGGDATGYKNDKDKMLAEGYKPVVHLFYFDALNQRKYCDLWIKPGMDRAHYLWAGDQAYASQQLQMEAIQTDVSVTINPANKRVLFVGVQWLGSPDSFSHFMGMPPDELRNRGTEQAAAGNVPCSLSVTATPSGELVGVAVWRSATNPQTPLELASLEKPAPPTPAPPEANQRALRFAGQGSIELRDSVGLANISRDFTLEAWLRFNDQAYGTTNILFGTGAYRGLHPEVSTMAMKGWLAGIKPARKESSTASQFILQWAESSGQTQNHTGDIPAFDDQWHHLALCNRASTAGWEMVVYVDGKESLRASHSDAKDSPSPVGLYLGRPGYVAASRRALNGLIRGCRLSTGVRYQKNFEPESQFKKDDSTLVLLDFSGANPSRISDVSGNQRDGQIVGADWVDLDGNPVRNMSGLTDTRPSPKPPVEKLAPPTTSENEVAKIRDVFKDEITAAKEPLALVAVAEKLLSQAIEEQDPAIQFALFNEARKLAIEGADWNVAHRVIDEQFARFKVNPWALRAETFSALTKKSKVASDRKILADNAIAQAETALNENAFESADSLLSSASNLAPRGERDLVKQISDLRKRLNDEKKSQQAIAEARATLERSPDDAAANEVVGKYLCFIKDDWDTGIQHLSKGHEGKLTALARNDETNPAEPNERMTLAEAWAEYAKGSTDSTVKSASASRALHWYQLAVPDLTGVKKLQAEKQIEELSKSVPSSRGKSKLAWLDGEPGVAMELRGHTADVSSLAIARSGRFLASGSQDDTVRIWDLASGKQAGQITPSTRDVHALLLSPDDRSIAIPMYSSGNASIGIWSIQNGQPIGSVPADGFSRMMAGSQDWRRVAYAKSQSGQGNILVYNLATLTPVAPLNCPGTPACVAVSRTGRYLAAADDNNVVYVWDMQAGKTLLPFTGHSENVNNLAFSPNERQLVSCSLRTVIVWDLAKGVEERRIAPANGVGSAATFSSDGSRLLVSGLSSEITLFSAKDGSQITQLTADAGGSVSTTRVIVCFPDSRAAATIGYGDSFIRIWRLP